MAVHSKMNNNRLTFWLDIMSNQNVLLTPVGTSIWQEGLSLLESLSIGSFFKSPIEISNNEINVFNFIDEILRSNREDEQKSFDIIGNFQLQKNSKLYSSIQRLALKNDTIYKFVETEVAEFKPWTSTIILGKPFYKISEKRIKVPFYSLNHENAHFALFKNFYSNINIPDNELIELFILIEWFCISLDLILAYDLIKSKSFYCLNELETITNRAHHGYGTIFSNTCKTINSLNDFSARFRKSFCKQENSMESNSLFSEKTLHNHINYAHNVLIKICRQQHTDVSPKQARELLTLLSENSLTHIIKVITGLVYAD